MFFLILLLLNFCFALSALSALSYSKVQIVQIVQCDFLYVNSVRIESGHSKRLYIPYIFFNHYLIIAGSPSYATASCFRNTPCRILTIFECRQLHLRVRILLGLLLDERHEPVVIRVQQVIGTLSLENEGRPFCDPIITVSSHNWFFLFLIQKAKQPKRGAVLIFWMILLKEVLKSTNFMLFLVLIDTF